MIQIQSAYVWTVTPRVSYWAMPAGAIEVYEDLRTPEEVATGGTNAGDLSAPVTFNFPDGWTP